ncbi:hypothetical protein BV22DRAFT_271064 [Leucogyrophana mollusca]|uniref:Uncharacterized protein n=1 Tax=Leucogyrophana mollusca TaxID=85980 RepID=A0ACB8BPE5_9AGAM|nr:hypothetical protein BV22DRAFT_271064 [Leucogyrophana mollusca]
MGAEASWSISLVLACRHVNLYNGDRLVVILLNMLSSMSRSSQINLNTWHVENASSTHPTERFRQPCMYLFGASYIPYPSRTLLSCPPPRLPSDCQRVNPHQGDCQSFIPSGSALVDNT